MRVIGLRRALRPMIRKAPACLLPAALLALPLLGGCEEELAPQITKFDLDPTCDVMIEHTAARLDENGLPVLDPVTQKPIIDVLGTWLDVRYFARASGGNRLDDPTGTAGTLEYHWDFGDGSSVQNRDSGTHRYTAAGSYTVTLTVKDKDGQTAVAKRDILVGDVGTTVDVLNVDIQSGHSTPSISSPTTLGRMITVDISDPDNPVLVDTRTLARAGRDIDVEGSRAFVAEGLSGFAIYDLTTPSNPSLMRILNVPAPAGAGPGPDEVQGIDVVGTTAYLAMRRQLILRADVSDPLNPVFARGDSTLYASAANLGVPSDLVVVGTTAVIANGFGILVADFADSQNPTLLGQGSVTPGNAQDVTNAGNTFLVSDGNVGLEVFDLSNPIFPLQTGWYGTPGNVTSATTDGNYAYVADDLGGIQIVDFGGGGNPTPIGSINTPGRALEIDKVGNLLYVANTGGLQIVDVTDAANPVLRGAISNIGQAESIAVAGNYAYVVTNGNLAGWIADLRGTLETPCPVSGLVAQYTWTWNFGDGSAPQSHSAQPRHVFPATPGSYDVTLTVKEEQSTVSRSSTLTVDIPEF